jgi:hypothetical protein
MGPNDRRSLVEEVAADHASVSLGDDGEKPRVVDHLREVAHRDVDRGEVRWKSMAVRDRREGVVTDTPALGGVSEARGSNSQLHDTLLGRRGGELHETASTDNGN